MGDLPHTYFKQGFKVEYGETIHASLMVRCSLYAGGTFYLQLYDETNSAQLDIEELEESTGDDYVQLHVSAYIPAGCTNAEVRWGWGAALDGTYFYVDKIRAWRGSAVRLTE